MSKMKVGSIDVTKILAAAKAGHSAFTRGVKDPTRIFANIVYWENDEKDENGFDSNIQLNSKKEKRKEEKKVYIANLKSLEKQGPDEQQDIPAGELEKSMVNVGAGTPDDPLAGLPF